jgi:predicted neutral ceramidase superfamily lipid hydrolase
VRIDAVLPCRVSNQLTTVSRSVQSTCVALNLIPFILQSLIMLGIIIAMNFSVTQLRVMVNNSPWVPSTPLQVKPGYLIIVHGVLAGQRAGYRCLDHKS